MDVQTDGSGESGKRFLAEKKNEMLDKQPELWYLIIPAKSLGDEKIPGEMAGKCTL
jgi:hypothetical protein